MKGGQQHCRFVHSVDRLITFLPHHVRIKIANGFRGRFDINVCQLFRETLKLECYRNKSIDIKSLIDRKYNIDAS